MDKVFYQCTSLDAQRVNAVELDEEKKEEKKQKYKMAC